MYRCRMSKKYGVIFERIGDRCFVEFDAVNDKKAIEQAKEIVENYNENNEKKFHIVEISKNIFSL